VESMRPQRIGTLVLILLIAGGGFYLGFATTSRPPRLVAIGILMTALLLWGANALPAACLGAAVGLLCSLTVDTTPRVINVIVAVAVAALLEWRFQLIGGLGKMPSRHRPAFRLREALRSSRAGPGQSLGLNPADRRTVLREGQLLISFVVAALYAASWLASEWFYGSLGVTPEEVGLGTVDLLVISGVLAALLAFGFLMLDVMWRRVRHAALRIPLFTLVAGVVAALLTPWPVAILYGLVGAALGALTASDSPVPALRSLRWIAVAASIVAVGLGVTAYFTSGAMRERLIAGKPVNPVLLNFQIAVLWAPTARIWPVENAALPAELANTPCVHRLGNTDGVTVFYAAGRVFRLPAQSVLTTACVPA
jgi:hypothetical protein